MRVCMNRFQPTSKLQLRVAVKQYCKHHVLKYGPIGTWDTSRITDMSALFCDMSTFNESIVDWNTSSVTNMECMFQGCTLFNQPLHLWDTSSVTDMIGMFRNCTSFNQPLHMWNISFVVHKHNMLVNCSSFCQPMGAWHEPESFFTGCVDPVYCSSAFPDYDVK